MTPYQRKLARHALGLPTPANRSYRNRYFSAPEGQAFQAWEEMAAAGEAEPGVRDGQSTVFFCLTKTGAAQALDAGETLDPEDFA